MEVNNINKTTKKILKSFAQWFEEEDLIVGTYLEGRKTPVEVTDRIDGIIAVYIKQDGKHVDNYAEYVKKVNSKKGGKK